MTWNTQLYTEKTLMPISKKYKSIVNVVKGYLEKANAICFLQEIPYYSNETWEKHTLYLELKKDFSEAEYDVIFNIASKRQIMMTVAIAKKGIISKLDSRSFNTNRTVTIKYKQHDFAITGIHASNGNDNKSYLLSIDDCKSSIILGDFNAGDYAESENQAIFNNILKNYTCICNEITRWPGRPTPIDHVFVNTDILLKCTNCIVHKEIIFSDHYPVTFSVELD